ncbi:hypothetical protein HWV62_227 [Athelia sp. TMB]|nr:hypothetical protein HWV62_227 [Athelia sp. TMB]
MAFHKTSLMCAAEISIGDFLQRSQYGQDVELDLHDGKAELQGRIKTRLSLASNGSLIASNAQQLALELVRNANTSSGGYIDGVFSISLQTPPAVIDQPIQDVLDKLNLFMRIAGEAAKVHPYAKLAWDVLSAAHTIIMAQLVIDQSIVDLAKTMQDVYSFVDAIEAVPSKIRQLEDVIHRIFVQTVECAVFIREYSGHGFAGRILRETMGASTPAKVAGMAQNLVDLHGQFDTGVAVQTAIFCFRIQQDVTALLKNQTLMQLGSCGAPLSSRTGCLAGTRCDVIREIQNWAIQPSTGDHSSILWVYSMAGTGKSAVAASVATHFSEVERLGAFLCFDESCSSKSYPSTVVKALAHQLALYDGRLGALIIQAVNDDTRILSDSLPKQFDRLIVKPLESLPVIHGEGPIIVVLDGLDECGQPDGRASLLEILAYQTKALPSNLRFIITSRAVGDIREAFTMPTARIKLLDLGLACGGSTPDITVYFKSRMQEIRRKTNDLPADWPGQGSINKLVTRACGFFAWAVATSTSIDTHSPLERLKSILEDDSFGELSPPLDNLYTTALRSAGDWKDAFLLSDFRVIMIAIIASPIPLSLAAIEHSTDRPLYRPVLVTIERLGGLLMIRNHVVQPLHPSFLAFLTNRKRCGRVIWYFEPRLVQNYTFPDPNCFQRMSASLDRSICNITIPASWDADALPKDLKCACQIWADYIFFVAENPSRVMETLQQFLQIHLLHWFEAMSIIKKSEDILPMLERAAAWLKMQENSLKDKTLELLVIDAIEFARNFAADIAEHPLYVFYTALPLHPPDSIFYQTFHDSRVRPSVSVLRDHLQIAYSSDGRRYAAWNICEEDSDIVVKETATGQELLKIANNGKLRYVNSVAFSYDGSRIAARSFSHVYVWDSVAGAEAIGPLSHSTCGDWVRAEAWSTNGERLVSASLEGEMILWDTTSAESNRLSTTRLPNSFIVSVAFSSDGSQIAGCSVDGRVFVWDPLGGSIVWSIEIPGCSWPRVSFSSNDMGEYILVKWEGGAQAHDLSTGALLPPPDSLGGAIGLSRGGFMVDLLYRRIRIDMRWENDRYLEWGQRGEFFAFQTGGEYNAALGRHKWQYHVVLLPKGID